MNATEHWSDVCKMYNAFRDKGLSHPDAIKGVQAKYSGLGPGNQTRLQDQYKPSSTKVSDNWEEACKLYNSLRDKGLSHDDAIKVVSSKYTEVGPGNQSRLERQYTPVPKPPTPKPPTPKPPTPPQSDVISTLNLNLITKGGGDWNIDSFDMKKSIVTTFQGKTVVKAQYDKNSGTSGDPGVGGFRFAATPNKMNKNEITFAWDVWYPKGFDFAKGGKHGGVFIGRGAASGYQHSTTGSSNRVMWQRSGGIIDYIYPPSDLKQKIPTLDPNGHGIGFFQDEFKNALKYDFWNRVEIGTKMNTFKNGVPQLDGESVVVVNGKKAVLKGINWSCSPDLMIDHIDWNSFFGGPDPSPKSQFAYFTNFTMKKYQS